LGVKPQMLVLYPDRVNPAVLWNSARAVKHGSWIWRRSVSQRLATAWSAATPLTGSAFYGP